MRRGVAGALPACPARRGRAFGWAVAGAFLIKGLVWLGVAFASWSMV